MTRTHEIKLDGYGAHTTLAEDRPIMLLGTAESYGIETLHVVSGESWEGLTITATFNAPDGTSTDMLMNADGSITVPSEATAKSGSGKIVFTGVSEGVQRISCDLEYFVVAHSAINGVQSGGTAPSWFEQAATRFMPPGGAAGQVLTKLTNTDFAAGWQDSQGGAGLAPLVGTTQTITPSQVLAAIKAGRDIALQHNTNLIMGTFVFSAFNANETQGAVVSNSILPQFDGLTVTLVGSVANDEWAFAVKNMATKDDVGTAVDEALAQAKASGEFDGADGKSAYQYAVEGGYTGTEAEFATKIAQEKFANPNALTFTGAVTGSYDGSAPLSVKIPEGGSGEAWELLYETTLTEDAATFSQEIPACSKVKMMIFPGCAISGWKQIIINGTSYPTNNRPMTVAQAYFVSIDTLLPPYITASIGIYTNPAVNGINGGFNYSSYGEIGDSITKIGCGTAEMLVTGAIIKILGVRK